MKQGLGGDYGRDGTGMWALGQVLNESMLRGYLLVYLQYFFSALQLQCISLT